MSKCSYGGGTQKLCDEKSCKFCESRSFAPQDRSKEWAYEYNDGTPRNYFKCSNKKFWFLCSNEVCQHYYQQALSKISLENNGCPFCCIPVKRVCDDETCDTCFNKTFISSEYAKYWSDKNEISPRFVLFNTRKKYWFTHDICGHTFQKQIANIKRGFCPYCSNNTILCGDLRCSFCFSKSFASNPLASRWSEKNDIGPHMVANNSNKYFILNCSCGHEYRSKLNSLNGSMKCSYCSKRKLCENDECLMCFEHSFASHFRAKYIFDDKINPRMVFKHSRNECTFKCDEGHIFTKVLYSVSCNNGWCPRCKNKTEKKAYDFLIQYFPDVVCEEKFAWNTVIGKKECIKYKFDFYIPSLHLVIEVDGNQHFDQVFQWGSHELTRTIDVYKMKLAVKNNITVLRILQTDIYYDKTDWQIILLDAIKRYSKPCVVYLSDESIYENHQSDYMDYSIGELIDKIKELKLDYDGNFDISEGTSPKISVGPERSEIDKMDFPDVVKLAISLGKNDADQYKLCGKDRNKKELVNWVHKTLSDRPENDIFNQKRIKPSKTKLKTMDLPSLIELATSLGKDDASEYKAGAKTKNKTSLVDWVYDRQMDDFNSSLHKPVEIVDEEKPVSRRKVKIIIKKKDDVLKAPPNKPITKRPVIIRKAKAA